jgi:hypothetical protein
LPGRRETAIWNTLFARSTAMIVDFIRTPPFGFSPATLAHPMPYTVAGGVHSIPEGEEGGRPVTPLFPSLPLGERGQGSEGFAGDRRI